MSALRARMLRHPTRKYHEEFVHSATGMVLSVAVKMRLCRSQTSVHSVGNTPSDEDETAIMRDLQLAREQSRYSVVITRTLRRTRRSELRSRAAGTPIAPRWCAEFAGTSSRRPVFFLEPGSGLPDESARLAVNVGVWP